jgi:uncharacterized membrane protein
MGKGSGKSAALSIRGVAAQSRGLRSGAAFGKGRPAFAGVPMRVPVVSTLARRPRLLIGAAIGVAAYFLTPASFREATRALIGWNVGAWAFLAAIAQMMAISNGDRIRDHAHQEDEKPFALLVIAVLAAGAAVAAILWELGPVKDMKGADKALHLGLVGATILSAWAFTHMMFALHYAAQYYVPEEGDDDDGLRGGFAFPQCDTPGWGEFCYEAFVIGCACATADVNLTSRGARAVCLLQGVVAFFFNTIILALTINIGAGLI